MRTVLDFNLNEPMEIDELPGKGILFVERSGLPNKFGTIFFIFFYLFLRVFLKSYVTTFRD